MNDFLRIRGARQHNLRGVDVDIPRHKLVVITGLSGSGKSSLAFDTIYAEGQRRYVESLSTHARQFLQQMAKPKVDAIEGLSPAISIEQRPLAKNPRSTVGTVTEVHDHLRLLFARVGRPHCPGCGKPLSALSPQQMVDRVLDLPEGSRFVVSAPLLQDEMGDVPATLAELRKDGFVRVELDGVVHELCDEIEADPRTPHTLDVHVDRLVSRPGIRSRLADSLELALSLSDGMVRIAQRDGPSTLLSSALICVHCGGRLPELTPRLFSFNSPHGACPTCDGLGELWELSAERIVPDPLLSLRQGAIAPWAGRNAAYRQQQLEALSDHFGFDLFVPYGELPDRIRQLLMDGSGDEEVTFHYKKGKRKQTFTRPFEGVIPGLQRKLADDKRQAGEGGGAYDDLRRFMVRRLCPGCQGARLRPEALCVTLAGRTVAELSSMTIERACLFFEALQLEGREAEIGARMLREIGGRLSFLRDVGLGYLSLDRGSATLSGGEGQRVRLATQIGAALVGVLYVLDEPSIGLHARDHRRLLQTLLRLRDAGNSVLVVEHDEPTIRAADYLLDMGPGAGAQGGELVACGTPEQVQNQPQSITGQYLRGDRGIEVPRRRRAVTRRLTLRGASQNNLRGLDVGFPLGTVTCVTGVSGSGKSTLVIDTLLPALRNRLHNSGDRAGVHTGLDGAHRLDKVIAIDQTPIGRSARSNPATYSGVFAPIRELLAGLPDSRARGYRAGRYSFNVKGGRCEACKGEGVVRIEMHFLPDLFVPCDVCGGSRYNRETLQVRYRGHSVADLLDLTVKQAEQLLGAVPAVAQKLATLREVGLGYLKLGQPAATLSGGEAQRLKLSRELSRAATGKTLYILDEPTTGLHVHDIHLLLDVLGRLVDGGNTVLIIEHHLDVIKCADWVIDLGPEGGEGGGAVVVEGTPQQVAEAEGSYTGAHLRRVLQ